jgi:hypothetical protein
MQNFPANFPKENILAWCDRQLDAVCANAAQGIVVDIQPAKKQRTYRQNRYMHGVFAHIAKFVNDNGGWLDGVQYAAWAINGGTMKTYFKNKFGIIKTAKLSTAEMTDLIDRTQAHMQTETRGEYRCIFPDDPLLAAYYCE